MEYNEMAAKKRKKLKSYAFMRFLRGYEFCQRGALEHSGRSCRTDGDGGTLRTSSRLFCFPIL